MLQAGSARVGRNAETVSLVNEIGSGKDLPFLCPQMPR